MGVAARGWRGWADHALLPPLDLLDRASYNFRAFLTKGCDARSARQLDEELAHDEDYQHHLKKQLENARRGGIPRGVPGEDIARRHGIHF